MKHLTTCLTLAFVCAFAYPVSAHAGGRVVVMTKTQNLAMDSTRGGVWSSPADDAAAEIVTAELLRQGYRVVERSALSAVLREAGFQRSGIVDQNTAVRIGRLAGARAILLVNIYGKSQSHQRGTGEDIDSVLGGFVRGVPLGKFLGTQSGTVTEVNMTLKMIDVETAEISWLEDKSAHSQPGSNTSDSELIRQMVRSISFPSPPEGGRAERSERRPRGSAPREEASEDGESVERPPRAERVVSAKSSADRGLRAVQGRLKELRYYEGNVDGRHNEETRRALIKFQHANNLLLTGTPDAATKKVLGLE